jgi:hypothetical protein
MEIIKRSGSEAARFVDGCVCDLTVEIAEALPLMQHTAQDFRWLRVDVFKASGLVRLVGVAVDGGFDVNEIPEEQGAAH